MVEKIKTHQRLILTVLIAICMGIVLAGGIFYVEMLRENFRKNAVENVMGITRQQQQAMDTFIAGDRERLHSYAEYFANDGLYTPEEVRRQMKMFGNVDATYSVMCLDDGWFCSNINDSVRWVDREDLEAYRAFTGSGVRDSFTGLFSGAPRFGYYEAFTFSNGHRGLMQKSYDRTKMTETFSLSFYDDQGLAYVVNQQGDILFHSSATLESQVYSNIMEMLSVTAHEREEKEQLSGALEAEEPVSLIFDEGPDGLVYSFVPMEAVDGWYLVSVVPVSAIMEETDHILLKSQLTLGLLLMVLAICAVFVLLIWQVHKDIEAKDREVKYQTQLFDIFTTYLSRNTDDLYMLVDHETEELEYVSPNVERVLGVPKEKVFSLLETSDMEADSEKALAYYRKVQSLRPGEAGLSRSSERLNPKTGERKYFLESTYCTEIQGRVKRVVYISDRTEERKTQKSLSEALRMAQAANDAKSAFLSSVSHDIRTPMNAIIGFLALMRDEAENPETVREYTQRIDAASQHLLGLINDVLDMNKIESGGTSLSISEMNLAEVIDEINTIIRPQTKAKGQTFDIFVSHLNYEHLLGDKLRINQILINLMSNAVKYTPNGGIIQLRVEELPRVVDSYSRIRFSVIDNGLGMSQEYQRVIFDAFTREETKITHEIQGTGLGMAITKSLVDLMGGTIAVESEPGKGSTFTVELELRIQERGDDPRFWTNYEMARMIVADDDEDVCRNIVKAMSGTGVVTEYATDGETALRMMRESREAGRPYDLILLDWKMPNLDGLETARLIRKNYSDKIPILLLTAYDWREIEEEAREIGVSHFMPKPFFMTKFKEAIRRLMGDHKNEEAGQTDVVQGKRVLVVDDIEVNRIILVKILSTLGAACDTASNGQEALEKFEASSSGEYDLILMDVQMPVMDGYAATRAIRSSGHPEAKTVSIIAMTANAFVDDVRDAIDSGMDAHIAKPVQIEKLKATIQQVLDSRKEQ